MKIYHIAGKEYAVSGDNLYEQVPEFIGGGSDHDLVLPITASIVPPTPPLPLRKKPLKKATKQARKYVPKKGYKRGTCGKCGEEGHSAWHCPERKAKKGSAAKSSEKEAFRERILARAGKVNRCGKCGKPGHKATTCPEEKAAPLTEDQINYIKEQSEAGVSVEKIVMDTGLEEREVRKYW